MADIKFCLDYKVENFLSSAVKSVNLTFIMQTSSVLTCNFCSQISTCRGYL